MIRRKLDAYYSPDAAASALVGLLPIRTTDKVLEPHAGGGAFVRALLPVAGQVHARDIDADAAGLALVPGWRRGVGDWFEAQPLDLHDWIIGNPPFAGAEEHVRHALKMSKRHVAFLLRLGFLESATRHSFWQEHPARRVWVLVERPSFQRKGEDKASGKTDGRAYGFYWWDKEHTGETVLDHVSWKT